jgi:glycosyltransferase involved in cell wall biosynthesis
MLQNRSTELDRTNRLICVALVVDDLGYGGAERQVIELANNIDRNRFDVHVCTLGNHLPLRSQLKLAEHNLHVIARKIRFDFTVVLRLAHLLRELKADIVHGYLFSAEIASRLAGRIAGTKLIIGSERNANRIEIRKSNVLAYRVTQRCVDMIIANSHAGAESHRRTFNRPASGYRVVHNGVDTERFRPGDGTAIRNKLGIRKESSVIGAFANFKKQKNHAMLFRTFRVVLESFPEAQLLLVGDEPTDSKGRLVSYRTQLDQLVDELGIRQQCVFLGHQNHTEHIYPACDITVLPSLHEGTPNVLLESMACGVPVVATNVCDNHYIIRDGETGHLMEVGDETGMARQITRLLADRARRQAMGRNGREWVMREFSTKRLAEKMEAIYIDLLDASLAAR